MLPIQVPPLRERKGDILFLLDHLKRQIGVELAMTPETEELLVRYPWHGNVRELKNCAEYLAYLDKRTIEARDLAPILKWPDRARQGEDPGLTAFIEQVGLQFGAHHVHPGKPVRQPPGQAPLRAPEPAARAPGSRTCSSPRRRSARPWCVPRRSATSASTTAGAAPLITASGIEALKQLRNPIDLA